MIPSEDRLNATRGQSPSLSGRVRFGPTTETEVHRDEEEFSDFSSESDDFDKCECTAPAKPKSNYIPYSSIYEYSEERRRTFFIPSLPVIANIISVRKDTEHAIHLLNPYTYTIELEHGKYTWTVERKYTDFQKLHNRLLVTRAAHKIAAPMRKIRRQSVCEPRTFVTLRHKESAGLRELKEEGRCSNPNSARNYFAQAHFDPSVEHDGVGGDQSAADGDAGGATVAVPPLVPSKSRRKHKIPKFPLVPDSLVLSGNIGHRRDELQKYLVGILHVPSLRNRKETAEFLEVSYLSFVHNLGAKWKEGMMKKRPGGRLDYRSLKRYCCEHCGKWNKRWLVVKDSFLAYINPHSNSVQEVLLFDPDFAVTCTGSRPDELKKSLTVSNLSRELVLKCESDHTASLWHDEIKRALNGPGHQWLRTNRFGSSFPVRENSYAQWFVDGQCFMEHAANMLEIAKEEIFVTDWWLTPEVYLKRPARKNDPWQLLEILRRKAEQGVRVFVLVYKELEMALGIGSAYAKRILMALSPKILVMRHPEHIPVPWMWAHHEKVIVVDQNIAFVGGIDLCYGRWDDHSHKLVDLGNPFLPTVEPAEVPKSELKVITGLMEQPDGSNEVALEDADASDAAARPRNKWTAARWRSIAHRALQSSRTPVEDQTDQRAPALSARFSIADVVFKYQSYLESDKMQRVKNKENTPPLSRRRRFSIAIDKFMHKLRRESVGDGIYNEYETMLCQIQKNQEVYEKDAKGNLWIGKDYVNFIFKDVVGLELPYCDLMDRKAVPRMPWHDISSVVYGEAARDVARHFIQRWNACKSEKLKKAHIYPFLMPKSYENVQIPSIFRRMSHKCTAQILRSARSWSCGINTVEESIHQAYVSMIANAKHYIYIENQFFITMIDSKDVRNQVAQALLGRIVKAHRCKETFRVFVVMPLLPAFEGQLGEASGAPLQTILYWTYGAISKGPNSLLYNLSREIGDYSPYIQFYSLRTYADLCGRLVSEQVYIHSKLIIVDDRIALIGSANINDRSQLGERDSEVALYVEDKEFFDSEMNGRPYKAGRFAQSLRKQLFSEHLGLLPTQKDLFPNGYFEPSLNDPVSDHFYKHWCTVATKNTGIYDEVFKCFPSDDVRNWVDLSRYKVESQLRCPAITDRPLAEKRIAQLCGYLVEFPTKFLADENLAPQILSKEGLAPAMLFT